ncbi:MAG: hypothetical protein COV67_06915 [Nitrospinae bacterium CG11_big_fil_rev_8_21_14_0_20_56_8]|nr:MAG: hypothetical protein COV67_06915 [Nitrospinae bacterium CG11_big_fil_rev_8_21_14_0_20_56_8]
MNQTGTRRIGLVAGSGEIPLYFVKKACEKGIRIISVSFTPEIAEQLSPFVETGYCIGIGRPNKMFKTMKEEQVKEIMILGKVDKKVIFQPSLFDLRALKFFKRLKSHEDRSLMEGVIEELEQEGFTLLDQKALMPELFPGKGVLTRHSLGKRETADIEFGLPIARKLADMEIGQTLIVKNQTVVAVEAVEGTDQAIDRGCALSRGKCVAVKVSRTDQDYRYDSPGVGPRTLERLIAGGAAALAIEADRVMIVDRERTVEMADRAGLAIVSV